MTDDAHSELHARLQAAPEPLSDSPPWPPWVSGPATDESYSAATEAIAKAMLLLLAERPELVGGENAMDLYDVVRKRWPGFNEWVGGATGFMVGWAANVASQLSKGPPVPNPALWTIHER